MTPDLIIVAALLLILSCCGLMLWLRLRITDRNVREIQRHLWPRQDDWAATLREREGLEE
jgi:hypothetical protein